MIKKTISVIVITYNEENNIDECLKSVKWADEIILVDSYSTDNTIIKAKKYTDKIFHKKFEDDFSKQKNYALSKVNSDWILILDADEKLKKDAKKKIRNIINNNNMSGYWFPRRNYINNKTYLKHGLFYPDWQLRLIQNNKNIEFIGAVHELPNIPSEKTSKISNIEIIHNSSRTKYNSFQSFYRLYPFIKLESHLLEKSNIPITEIFKSIILSIPHELWWNIIERKGYKDSWYGIKATLIYSFYRELIYLLTLTQRLRMTK